MTEFESAVVFGKFWPLHVGHLQLISEALSRADRVLVVRDDGSEDVPTQVRMGWVRVSARPCGVSPRPLRTRHK